MSHGGWATWLVIGAIVLLILKWTGILGFVATIVNLLFWAAIIGAAIFGWLHLRGRNSIPE